MRCCGSSRWAAQMVERRPFTGTPDLFAAAEDIWYDLSSFDWMEAFSHHPKIGDPGGVPKKSASTKNMAAGEQAGVQGASPDILKQLAEGNQQYEKKFKFIFIISAAGKSAKEMLAQLKDRLNNDVAAELKVAAGEQNKITRLRLQKLIQP
jgi:2-oxo-4-hydroxy-4-carboxy-5-ureidoimidazoline decarboxylase